MEYLVKYKKTIIGVLIGTVAGYLYYYFIGCTNGQCAITSNPIHSSFYGAMVGGMFFNLFEKEKPKNNN